jgi:Anti-sigma-K factor rskA
MTEDLTGGRQLTDDELDALLADPSMWVVPSAGLAERVVTAVQHEASPSRSVVSLQDRRSRLSAPTAALLGAAAASVLTLGAVRFMSRTPVQATSALVAPATKPGATGSANMRETNSGWEIRLNAPDLKRLDKPFYYEAWVFSAKGDISIGTFHSGTDVVLWAGVELDEYPELIITIEEEDNNPVASTEVALSGPIVFKK